MYLVLFTFAYFTRPSSDGCTITQSLSAGKANRSKCPSYIYIVLKIYISPDHQLKRCVKADDRRQKLFSSCQTEAEMISNDSLEKGVESVL